MEKEKEQKTLYLYWQCWWLKLKNTMT